MSNTIKMKRLRRLPLAAVSVQRRLALPNEFWLAPADMAASFQKRSSCRVAVKRKREPRSQSSVRKNFGTHMGRAWEASPIPPFNFYWHLRCYGCRVEFNLSETIPNPRTCGWEFGVTNPGEG